MLIGIVLAVFIGSVSFANAGEGENDKTPTAQAKKVRQVKVKTCLGVHQGINFYRRATHKWERMRHVEITKVSKAPIPRAACGYARFVAKLWTKRAFIARVKYKEYVAEWNWRAFPQWIQDLARCESSYNWWAEGSSSDGVFYSAFNISRSQYDIDAHHMGVRGWNEGPGVPSPKEQAMAVIGHMRLLGDGFTGRCHGIAQANW